MDFHSHDPVLKNKSSPLKINHTTSNSGQKSGHSSGQISGHSSGHSSGVKKQVSS
jgi:hypothetical protein